ncbi:MAG: VWA domain-containing protein [Hyphomicrobiales bacterium]|nr:VWA domain-containing protein [Hyphomicrobiales bacterium]
MLKQIVTIMGLAILILGPAPASVAAGDTERAVLVLDASGSMWGQVDDVAKITVARNVIRKLVSDWDPKVQLELTAYGHREKGNCANIESLVPVGNVAAGTIMAAINKLTPKGKTPLSDAVRQAARDLKYTEERATVILVSDGKETCNADPCAVAAELERSGVDFTVHVVGFDLTEDEKAHLRCVADNTGGKFLSAKNASELHNAMTTTVQLVAEAKPVKKRVVKLKTGVAGSLLVKGLSARTYVRAYVPGKTYKDALVTFTSGRKHPEQLVPGTYVLGTGKQELTRVEIASGENVIVDMKDVSGSLLVKGLGARTYVRAYAPGAHGSEPYFGPDLISWATNHSPFFGHVNLFFDIAAFFSTHNMTTVSCLKVRGVRYRKVSTCMTD